MTPDPFQNLVDDITEHVDLAEQFHQERLNRDDLATADWPSQIDRAATDVVHGLALGHSDSKFDHGGTIGTIDFGRATGGYYVEGLIELSGEHSDLPSLIQEHENKRIGNFVLAIAKLRHELENADEGAIRNIDRAIEAIVEKLATRGMGPESGRQPFHQPQAVVDVVYQLFSDPTASEYAKDLLSSLDDVRRTSPDADLLEYLDQPQMVTPLWDHQQEALSNWCEADYDGYVNMATATGKTVLGLGAIAHIFGELHPRDEVALPSRNASAANAKVLIVAGQDLLLEQWQSEFDEHLNIPRDRTGAGDNREIELSWGTIEFRTAQDLLRVEAIGEYDLVILDEAHRYRSGSRDGRSWRDLFETLTDRSGAILAMSGSIDQNWLGDDAARSALEANLAECATFSIPEAREANVIADFSWEVMYAASAGDDTLEGVTESTQPLADVYDRAHHKFVSTDLEDAPDTVPDTFETLRNLRSFAQSNEGSEAREQSPAFDRVATAAFSRRPRRWQLSPPGEAIRRLVIRHIDEEKCIVLVQSYEQARQIGDILRTELGDNVVAVADGETSSQSDLITQFKESEQGVLVGPGEVIGVGVDVPDADVAINLSKGGVNASLIQRIGRVLRNPSGDNRAHFYHIVTLPATPDGQLAGEDGRLLLRRASEFRALGSRFRELPTFTTIDDQTAPLLAELEIAGSKAMEADHRSIEEIEDDDVAQEWLYELLVAIEDRNKQMEPALPEVWTGETVDPRTEPIRTAIESRERSRKKSAVQGTTGRHLDGDTQQEELTLFVTGSEGDPVNGASVSLSPDNIDRNDETDIGGKVTFDVPGHTRRVEAIIGADGYERKEVATLLHGRSGPYNVSTQLSRKQQDDEPSSSSGKKDSSNSSGVYGDESASEDVSAPDGEEGSTISPSELTELYDSLHSLKQAIDTLIKVSEIEEGPTVTWRDTLAAFLDSGLDDWDTGYGKQQLNRSGTSAAEYREEFGDGDRVTDFRIIERTAPSPLLKGLHSRFSDNTWVVVPIAPSSRTPLPVVIDSDSGLVEAKNLLTEFPEVPDIGNTPVESSESNLTTVSGVTEEDAAVLKENGFETVDDLEEAPYEDIVSLREIPDHLALRIKADVE